MGQRGKLQGILEKIKLNSNEDKHIKIGEMLTQYLEGIS